MLLAVAASADAGSSAASRQAMSNGIKTRFFMVASS